MLRRCIPVRSPQCLFIDKQGSLRFHSCLCLVLQSQLFHKSQLSTSATGVLLGFIVTSSQWSFCQNLHHSLWACRLLLGQPHVLPQLVLLRWRSS